MHLADYDEQLITNRPWSEPRHIEQQLAELTEQIGNITQDRLRDKFKTIEEYNAQAGEVAEPYRVLVVFDFPTNFSEDAARRLVSIAQNGPRCGVYAIVMVDTAKKLPYNFDLEDLERTATVIAWDGSRFVWQDEDFKACTLELDTPPDTELFNRIVTSVGEAAKDASKVEVPFERMFEIFEGQRKKFAKDYPGLTVPVKAEDSATWWKASAATGLVAPLGRTGPDKIQCLDFGKGVAVHALMVGQTGSGKSTLLHTLITSLALTYSPSEAQLYLIDFKQGVEFKTYATHQLPHARVIAIESEREFGISVLRGLQDEFDRRSALFRSVGEQNLLEYRQKTGEVMPRLFSLWTSSRSSSPRMMR